MISRRVILICVLTFYFSVLIKGQPNDGYSQCEDMRQGFFNHYYCTLQCFGEVLHLSYIRGNLCEGAIELGSNTKEPVPLPVVGQIIECITVRCKSALPPSVCGGFNGFVDKNGASQKSQPDPIDYHSDVYPYVGDYHKKENNGNRGLKEGENTKQKSVNDTATAESVAYDVTDKKSNNYHYGVDFYYDGYYYDDDFYYDKNEEDHSNNGKEIPDDKKLSAVDSKKKSDEVRAIADDAKYKISDDSGHDNGHYNDDNSEGDDSDRIHNDNDDLKTESNKEVKSGKNSDVKDSYTGESIKQEDKKEPSKEKSVIETSNQESKKEKNAIKKFDQDSTKEENVTEKPNEDSTKEEDVEKSNGKSTKEGSAVEKPKEDLTKGGNVKKSKDESTQEKNVVKKSNEDSTKEENVGEKSKEDSTKEKNSVKKSIKDSIKEERVVEKSDQDSTKEKSTDKKSNANLSKKENVEKSNDESTKEENVVQKSDQDSIKKERIFDKSDEDSTKRESIVEKSDEDSTREENVDKNANDDSKKDKNVPEKSSEDSLKSTSDSSEQQKKEIFSQSSSDENTKDSLPAEITKGSSPTEATEDLLQIEKSEQKSSTLSESISKDKSGSPNHEKEISKTSQTSAYIAKAVSSPKDVNNVNNKKESEDEYYQSYTKNPYPQYDTNTNKNPYQPNTNLNYQPVALTEQKTFNKNDKYRGPSSGNTDFASSESGLGSKTNEFSVPNMYNKNNYQFSNDQEPIGGNYPIPNNAKNPSYPNNNGQISFQPAVPSKQQYLLGQNSQHFNMPQNTYGVSQVNAQAGPQNHPLNPPFYQNQFVPYPYGNMDYNIRGQPGNQYWKSLGIPNQGNDWNIQPQNSGLAQKAPNTFWNTNPQTQNQQVFPPNNAQFMNNGPSNLPVQHNVINTRVPSSQVYGPLSPWNVQSSSAVISQPTSWNGNMPSKYQAPPWSGPVNSPPAVNNAVGMQTYPGQPLGSDNGLPFERVNDEKKTSW